MSRELDALVAEHVMGWKCGKDEFDANCLIDPTGVTHLYPAGGGYRYSTSISDAFLVVEEMRRRGWDYEIGSDTGAAHMCDFTGPDYVGGDPAPTLRGFATDDSLPRAICLAALRALGVEVS